LKHWKGAIVCSVISSGLAMIAPAAHADTVFPDIPQNHWAYADVQDLAGKGIVKGYPDGSFLGNRAMTRYEFATIIDRMLQTIADMKSGAAPTNAVTQDDLNKVQVLVDGFKDELTGVKTDLSKAQDDITTLRGEIDDLRQDVQDTKDVAAKALNTANDSYGVGSKRKYQISGYIQTRFYSIPNNNDQVRFPNGKALNDQAYNGNYGQGGNSQSFIIRRSRLKLSGQVTQNTKYVIQLDASGLGASSDTSGVSIREGNVNYTTVDGNPDKHTTFTAGMFATPFGYILPLSSASVLSGERPLAFNEGGNGLFNGQDYDRGIQVSQPFGQFRLTGALINGTGRASNDVNTHVDEVYRGSWMSKDKTIGAGVSYYDGKLVLPGSTTGLGFIEGKRQLTGVDAQYTSPAGPFLLGEYLSGKYEARSYFSVPADGGVAVTSKAALGNKVEGYYIQGGYTFTPSGTHPFTLAASYDKLARSKSGVDAAATGGASGSSFDDVNIGYGALYNLDKATRLRLWYTHADSVAHAAGTASPPKIGLMIGEVQVKF
jgi:hypothetical protein